MKKLEPGWGNALPTMVHEIIMQMKDDSPALLTSWPHFSGWYLLPFYMGAEMEW